MINIYRSIFETIARWAIRTNGPDSGPEHAANAMISALAVVNIMSAVVAIELLLGRVLFAEASKSLLVVLYLVMLATHYLVFLRGFGRNEPNGRGYDARAMHATRPKNKVAWSYVIGTLCVFFFLATLRRCILL